MKTFITSAVSLLLLLVLVLAAPPPDTAQEAPFSVLLTHEVQDTAQEALVDSLLFYDVTIPHNTPQVGNPYTAPKYTAAWVQSWSSLREPPERIRAAGLVENYTYIKQNDTPTTLTLSTEATNTGRPQYGEKHEQHKHKLPYSVDGFLRYVFS